MRVSPIFSLFRLAGITCITYITYIAYIAYITYITYIALVSVQCKLPILSWDVWLSVGKAMILRSQQGGSNVTAERRQA